MCTFLHARRRRTGPLDACAERSSHTKRTRNTKHTRVRTTPRCPSETSVESEPRSNGRMREVPPNREARRGANEARAQAVEGGTRLPRGRHAHRSRWQTVQDHASTWPKHSVVQDLVRDLEPGNGPTTNAQDLPLNPHDEWTRGWDMLSVHNRTRNHPLAPRVAEGEAARGNTTVHPQPYGRGPKGDPTVRPTTQASRTGNGRWTDGERGG